MADVVRSGAIFRVRDAATRPSPNLRASSSSSSHKPAVPARVRRVTVSALEAASSVNSSQATSAGRTRNSSSGTSTQLPETPAGMPKRKARLQQTPSMRSVKKAGAQRATIERTPEEIESSFNQLVMETAMRKKIINARRVSNRNNSGSALTTRRTRSQSVSSASSSALETSESTPRLTRSATKARELAPAASPASSVQTQVLESTEEEDDEPEEDKTPPTKRNAQAKRQRADEPPSTSVRSSKRLRAQQRLLSSLPPARSPLAQIGNTAEDEELLQIQKRLVFGKSRKPKIPAKRSADTNSSAEEEYESDGGDESAERMRAPRSSPRRRSDQKQRLSASFSILEDVEALPISKTLKRSSNNNVQRKKSTVSKSSASKYRAPVKIVLCDWVPQWPLVYEQAGGGGKNASGKVLLVFEGRVAGRDAVFQVARRASATEFVSTANERVALDGCLDVEKAEARGIPEAVTEILDKGLPVQWRQSLRKALLLDKKTSTLKSRANVPTESESEPEEEDELLDVATMKRSRSGRVITPVMDWWRGERLKTDADGVTVVDHGSPAFLSSPHKKVHRAIASSKPSWVPVASKTPVKAKTPRAKAKQMQGDFDAPEWTKDQLQALTTAKMQIPTTAANFWAEVATFVDGKTATECRTKSFEEFSSPTSRAAHKKKNSEAAVAAVGPGSTTKIPTKIHRAGSNLFKKQVRQFVQQYEKKHVDDLFLDTTPSKSELVGTMGLDDIKSPAAPLENSANLNEDDVDDDFVGGREQLQEISSNKRDEVDSYVLSLKRSRVLGEPSTATKATRTSLMTPSTLKKKTKSTKRAVHMYEAVGSHRMEGVVSPGGTTHVRINKDSDATSDEEDERDSEDENSDDDVF